MNKPQVKIETFKKTNGSIQIDYNGAYIGSLRPPPSSGWFKEDEIDTEKIANLIAAAPEMLELLKDILAEVRPEISRVNEAAGRTIFNPVATETIDMAKELIAKAEGK